MKQIFIINCNRKSFGSKSISGYKKLYLLKSFEKSLISRNYYYALYFGFEMFCSGYFNDLWSIIFLFYIQHIHILNPELPFFLIQKYEYFKKIEKKLKEKKINKIKMRNLFQLQQDLIFIIKNLINTRNKHISYFIKPQYNNQSSYKNLEKRYILIIFKRFKLLLNKLVNNKITFTQTTTDVLNEFFDVFGKLMVIDCKNPLLVDYPHYSNIYHHDKDDKDFLSVSNIFWNTVLSSAKFKHSIFKQVGCIYKILDTKLIQKLQKESYIYICATLYFIYKLNDITPLNTNKDDFKTIKNFYENIQVGINNKTRRLDFIEIENKNEKKNKKSKKTKYKDTIGVKPLKKKIEEKVNLKDIVINMKPINYVITDSSNKKITNTNVEHIIQKNEPKIEETNDFGFDIDIHKYNNKNDEVEIVFETNKNKDLDKYQVLKNFMDDESLIPLKTDYMEKDDKTSDSSFFSLKNVSIPDKIYKKTVLNKPFNDSLKLSKFSLLLLSL